MAFDVILMRNNSEFNKVTKSTTTIDTISGELKESSSLIDPVIKLRYSVGPITRCNYVSIPKFERLYFVTDITVICSYLIEISCHCDVLSTYAAAIKACKGIVRRQENKWNLYIDDGSFRVYQNPMIVTKNFPNGFNTHEFVLAVAGAVNPSNT